MPEGKSRVTETTTEHHPPRVDPQIYDHSPEVGSTDNESVSDDEFYDCLQPEDEISFMEPVPSSINQPTGSFPAQMDPRKAAGPEPQSLAPKPVETLPQTRGMYRLLSLVTERGTGGISK